MPSVLIGGQAGQGIDKAAEMFATSLRNMGLYVFNYRDYPSLIRGGHNFNAITYSDEPVYSHEWEYDAIMAMDDETSKKHAGELKKKGAVLRQSDCKDADELIKSLGLPPISKNSYMVGVLAKTVGVEQGALEKAVEKTVGKEQVAITLKGYGAAKQLLGLKRGKAVDGIMSTGSAAVAEAALASGIERFIAYPMTPATPVFHYLAARQSEKFKAIQLENEIAVMIAAVASSYAGKMTMTATSGGGFALMTEGCSLAGIAEIPVVVNLAMRTGPASGLPTYTGQSELRMALCAGHGDFPRIVAAPGTPDEAYEMTQQLFYLAYKYNSLAILLTDKHLAESQYTLKGMREPGVKPGKFLENPGKGYAYYGFTKDGVSPRAIPGASDAVIKATSYEHDEYGNTTEDADMTVKMNDKRMRKMAAIAKDVAKMEPVVTYGKGRKIIVGWGSTKGAILDALKLLDGWKFVQVRYISPFPARQLMDALKGAEDIVAVEGNATGQLCGVIAENTGIMIGKKVLRYDGRPFTAKDVVEGVKHA